MKKNKLILSLISAIIASITAIVGSFTVSNNVSLATILIIVASSFGAGASVTSAVYNIRNKPQNIGNKKNKDLDF